MEGDSPLLECIPNPQGLLHRLLCQCKVELVREQCLELDAQKPPLGQHSALLLDDVAEVLLQGGIHNHHSLSKERPLLGSADVEHVGKAGNVLQGAVVLGGDKAVAQSGSIDVEGKLEFLAGGGNVLQLRLGVQEAGLGGKGEVHHSRLHGVLKALVGVVAAAQVPNLGGRNLSVGGWKGQNLVAAGFYGPRLVDGDVATLRRDDSLMAPQNRVDDGEVCLSAPHQKMHCRLWSATFLPDKLCRLLAKFILAVAHRLLEVCLCKGGKNLRAAALRIVALEISHTITPLVDGMVPRRRLSSVMASRMARAAALNSPSIL